VKFDREKHAPGTILLVEIAGTIHEAVIVGWSPMSQAVKLMVGQEQRWFLAGKTHAVEFLRIVGWDEFKSIMAKVEEEKANAANADLSSVGGAIESGA